MNTILFLELEAYKIILESKIDVSVYGDFKKATTIFFSVETGEKKKKGKIIHPIG